jgi:hypothetical protein
LGLRYVWLSNRCRYHGYKHASIDPKLLDDPVALPLDEYAGGFNAKNSTSEGKYYYGFYSIIRMGLSLFIAAKGRAAFSGANNIFYLLRAFVPIFFAVD